MLPKIIIDGYNVLHLVSVYSDILASDLEAARNQLIRDLQIYRADKKVEILVVFDGSAEIAIHSDCIVKGGIEIRFSHAPLKADPIIIKTIESEKLKKRIIVVTSDNSIKRFARSVSCDILSPQAFYRRIKTRSVKSDLNTKFGDELTEAELEEWKQLFGITD